MPTTTASARRAAAVVFATFVLNGFTFANWLSRIPTIRDELSLRERDLGLIIVVGSLGSVLSLPLAGRVIARIGARATVLIAAGLATLGLAVAVTGVATGLPLLLTAGLFVTTMGIGGWDVAMNFAGARVEQALGRAIMPAFHGGFSVGTVAGAGLGAVAIRTGIGVPLHVLT
ncbi:MAG TPA: MFS transporter, partial [Candidatus Ruania gallistercoris]|nr:MFS transporter [Candidatus Ruania gallistercoris]